jgi:predicted secreted hydrolase
MNAAFSRASRLTALALFVTGCSSSAARAGSDTPDASVQDGAADAGAADDACGAPASGKVALPGDDAPHDAGLEWWYWTGHVQGPDGGWFGFEEVVFSATQSGIKGQLVQSALTDVEGAKFQHAISNVVAPPKNTTNGFDLSVNGVTAVGGGGHDVLHGAPANGTSFDLTLDAVKPAVLQYGTGYKTYSDGDTYYYSRELLHATGTITVGSSTIPVSGQAWFDHQWGNLSKVVGDGWEWFAIQLDDDRQLMLNLPLANGAPIPAEGTLSSASCGTTVLKPGDVTVTSTGTWKSPTTACTYPMGWHVVTKDLDLTITPALLDQELPDSQPIYWEGAATVSGSAKGRAYVELNGFCK